MENKKTIKMAIMYDFDSTLSIRDMQTFDLFPMLGVNAKDFYHKANILQRENNMDMILAFLYLLNKRAKAIGKPLTKEILMDTGKNIDFFPGVIDWFERVNEYGKKHGVEVEHYLISSGIKEIVEGTDVAKYFKKIYACQYHYDEKGFVDWISVAVNYTNKTQFIYRINKGVLDVYDDEGVNAYMPKEGRAIPYKNMVYIGDGLTDVPCMKLVKGRGGCSIAVYEKGKNERAKALLEQQRVSFAELADYSIGSSLDKRIKGVIKTIAHQQSIGKE